LNTETDILVILVK